MYGLRDCLVDRRCCLYETKSLNDLAHSPSKYVFYESLALQLYEVLSCPTATLLAKHCTVVSLALRYSSSTA